MYYTFTKLIIRSSPEKLEMSQSHFQNEYIVIFVVQYTHHVDYLYISWFYLMHQLDSHVFVYYQLAIKYLLLV